MMEQFELITSQPFLPPTSATTPDMTPTNPSSLTLAVIGVGTLAMFGLRRRKFFRKPSLTVTAQPAAKHSKQRRAA